ncbi:MAG: decarboxylase [Betaproteobacteria bacterium]|nr:MAG: decarboxylase [Betaproteobacteria bacterium]
MLAASTIESIARRIKAAQDEAGSLSPVTSERSDFDVASAYAVADSIHRARVAEGAVPVGRKLGFTNRNIWDDYGVRQPIWAYVYDRTLVRGVSGRARCDIARFAEPKIEPEIVLHFVSAPPRSDDPAAILAAVDWIAHGFEIVQSHFPGWKFQVADTIADSALHGTLLVGEPVPVARLGGDLVRALESFSLTLSRDGDVCDVGRGANVLGSPLAAVAHLIDMLSRQPGSAPLSAGEIVTTGTVTAAHPIRDGQVWQTELRGIELPGLCVEFVG